MKRFFIFLCFLIAAVPVFSQKTYVSEKIVFLPQDFFVGDLVEVRVVIKPMPGYHVEKPTKLPDSYWISVENADIVDLGGKYELRVLLRPYAPGIRTLPPLQFGDIMLRDVRILTRSVLDENQSGFSPPAGQMLLPGTQYYIAILVGVVFILPVLLLVFWGRLRERITDYISRQLKRRPYKRFIRRLDELEAGLGDMKGRGFYTELIEVLREYLSERGRVDYESATTREAVRGLSSDFAAVDCLSAVIAIFQTADRVKFGSARVVMSVREEHLNVLRDAAQQIEKLYFDEGAADVDI